MGRKPGQSRNATSISVWVLAVILSQGIKMVFADECWNKSLKPLMEVVRKQMKDIPVYFTFDIDGIEPLNCPGTGIFTSHGRSAKARLSVCPFLKRVSGSSYTVENASNAALMPSSPEMKPGLAVVGSATVAVLSQSSGIAAIFSHETGVTWYTRPLHVVVQTVPWLLLL